jgi:serine/threonine protein phosphatase 1
MRTFAIGDIHGCLHPFNDLLEWVKPAADDLVVTLGDYIDRGPESKGVLDRLIALKTSGTKLVCLRGNHEIMMLEAYRGGRSELKMWMSVGGAEAIGSYGTAPGWSGTLADVPREHWNFLQDELLPYYETDTHIFVHAGVYPDLDMHEQHENVLYWEYIWDEMRHHSGKTVICGHSSQRSGVPKVVPGAVCIDTFAHGGGWLTCLEAATGKYWQVNLLGQKREGRVDYE